MQLHKIFIALFLLLTVPFILADENGSAAVSYTHLRAHATSLPVVWRVLL